MTEDRETPAEAALLHFAAEAHRRKWSFTESSPEAFDALHLIGNEMRAAVDEVRKAPAPLGTTGRNTISRAELGAHYRRQGVDQAGDWAARVFHDIAAHRESYEPAGGSGTQAPAPASPEPVAAIVGPAGAKDGSEDESRIADLENTIGQATMMAESMLEGGQISLDCARRLLSALGDDAARDAETFVRNRAAGRVPQGTDGQLPGDQERGEGKGADRG